MWRLWREESSRKQAQIRCRDERDFGKICPGFRTYCHFLFFHSSLLSLSLRLFLQTDKCALSEVIHCYILNHLERIMPYAGCI